MPTPQQGYYLLNGDKCPGTTTVIGRFKESGALMHWAWQQGKEGKDFRATKQEAADAGTVAHNMVDLHIHGSNPMDALEGVEVAIASQASNAFGSYLAWERNFKVKIYMTEMQLVHEGLRFGGTPDALGYLESTNSFCLLDWKTSNGLYADYLIQLAAYQMLVEEGHYLGCEDKPGTKKVDMHGTRIIPYKIDGFHLLRFAKQNGDFHHHYFPDLYEARRQFILFREAYDIDKQLKVRAK